jgi:hypothetical protein
MGGGGDHGVIEEPHDFAKLALLVGRKGESGLVEEPSEVLVHRMCDADDGLDRRLLVCGGEDPAERLRRHAGVACDDAVLLAASCDRRAQTVAPRLVHSRTPYWRQREKPARPVIDGHSESVPRKATRASMIGGDSLQSRTCLGMQ